MEFDASSSVVSVYVQYSTNKYEYDVWINTELCCSAQARCFAPSSWIELYVRSNLMSVYNDEHDEIENRI